MANASATGLELQGRAAIVTGAASGIGRAAALRLAEAGASVLVADINEAGGQAVADAIAASGWQAKVQRVDMADAASVDAMVEAAVGAFGRLDILINCAGIDMTHEPGRFSRADLHRIFAVNLDGPLQAAMRAAPHLAKSDHPRIVNISSVQGIRGYPGQLAYGASKGALANATRVLACDLGAQGICVNAVAPGYIDTPMSRYDDGSSEHDKDWFKKIYVKWGRIPLRRPASADEVAGPILFLSSPAASYVTGHVLVVDGGMTATF